MRRIVFYTWKHTKFGTTKQILPLKKYHTWSRKSITAVCSGKEAVIETTVTTKKQGEKKQIVKACLVSDANSLTFQSFGLGSTVKVPVLATIYSSIATSFPASFPYPEALIPPKGDSAADEFPTRWINECAFHGIEGGLVGSYRCSFQSCQPQYSQATARCGWHPL